MNQILDYNPNKGSSGGSSGSDKIVRVFAAILAVFAICLLVAGAYGLYNNSKTSNIPTAAISKAQINLEQQETKVVIKVTHDKVIEKLIYSWDSEKEMIIKGNGESTMETEISLFAGEHVLNVKVIDIDGNETLFEQIVTSEQGEDKINPVITYEITAEKKIKIIATDETALDFITYRWNDEEEQKVEVSEDEKKIEYEIEILKGKNDLTIIAVDKNNNSTTLPESFSGVTKPDVKITISADKKKADVQCYHENGLKEIKLTLNGTEYPVDIGTDNPKDIAFQIDLAQGNNDIKVTAKSIDETETIATETVENQPEVTDDINITIQKLEEDETKAAIKATCPTGIKEVKLNVNDVDYGVDLQGQTPPEMSFNLDLVEGNNKITLTVISVNGTEKQEMQEITR